VSPQTPLWLARKSFCSFVGTELSFFCVETFVMDIKFELIIKNTKNGLELYEAILYFI